MMFRAELGGGGDSDSHSHVTVCPDETNGSNSVLYICYSAE